MIRLRLVCSFEINHCAFGGHLIGADRHFMCPLKQPFMQPSPEMQRFIPGNEQLVQP
jgi:hypothetical protein